MHEPAENRCIKILFAVRIIVVYHVKNGYITLIVSIMTLMEEICGTLCNIIPDYIGFFKSEGEYHEQCKRT